MPLKNKLKVRSFIKKQINYCECILQPVLMVATSRQCRRARRPSRRRRGRLPFVSLTLILANASARARRRREKRDRDGLCPGGPHVRPPRAIAR
ncbi:hypothetical protein PUN28_019968 [Cardiocondyla obscurior]|uniref:Uncharacterized protein n=1 Tax=Cardiocondyla obscurior TaxID=286306 RepID=A0AAW2EC80_9HYME